MCCIVRLRYADLAIDSETTLDSSSASRRIRKSVRVRGVVQGVGFRPFVYRLATQNSLGGRIGNDTEGVTLEIEGAESARCRLPRQTHL